MMLVLLLVPPLPLEEDHGPAPLPGPDQVRPDGPAVRRPGGSSAPPSSSPLPSSSRRPVVRHRLPPSAADRPAGIIAPARYPSPAVSVSGIICPSSRDHRPGPGGSSARLQGSPPPRLCWPSAPAPEDRRGDYSPGSAGGPHRFFLLPLTGGDITIAIIICRADYALFSPPSARIISPRSNPSGTTPVRGILLTHAAALRPKKIFFTP